MAHLFDITKQREKFFIKKSKKMFSLQSQQEYYSPYFLPLNFLR